MQLLDALAAHLITRNRRTEYSANAIPCGVLVPLVPADSGFDIVYTLRSEELPNHRGQVSFPGGKFDPDEDATLEATAIREATEEVGLESDSVQIIGQLDDVATRVNDFVITPTVGIVRPSTSLVPNPSEVADIFTVHIDRLANRDFHGTETRTWKDVEFPVPVITAGKHTIWGATHSITTKLIEIYETIRPDEC